MDPIDLPAGPAVPYVYAGPAELRGRIAGALCAVVDPELAMNIVDVGLVYGVRVDADLVHVTMTMTSAACPVADVILEDVQAELDRVLPPEWRIEVELVHQPAWGPERMSARAKAFMGW